MNKILLVLIAVALGGGVYWYAMYLPATETSTDAQTQVETGNQYAAPDVDEWKTVSSPKHSVTFEVPESWFAQMIADGMSLFSVSDGTGMQGVEVQVRDEGDGKIGFDGTAVGFQMIQAQRDGFTVEYGGAMPASYTKIGNLTVSGYPAVRAQYYVSARDAIPESDSDIIWIRKGDANIYVHFSEFRGAISRWTNGGEEIEAENRELLEKIIASLRVE